MRGLLLVFTFLLRAAPKLFYCTRSGFSTMRALILNRVVGLENWPSSLSLRISPSSSATGKPTVLPMAVGFIFIDQTYCFCYCADCLIGDLVLALFIILLIGLRCGDRIGERIGERVGLLDGDLWGEQEGLRDGDTDGLLVIQSLFRYGDLCSSASIFF